MGTCPDRSMQFMIQKQMQTFKNPRKLFVGGAHGIVFLKSNFSAAQLRRS